MKFVTDGMLGKLTRWLRISGQDVICINDFPVDPESEDRFLLKIVDSKSRTLITRDKELHRRALRGELESIFIEETESVAKQMAKISNSVDEPIEVDIEKSRCPVCNGELEKIKKSTISEKVPEPVFKNNERFWRCECCGKIYWSGGHWENIAKTVNKYEKMKG